MQNTFKGDEFYSGYPYKCTENMENNLNAQWGGVSVIVHDLHLLAFPDKTKAIRSQDRSEKVV